MSVHPPLNLPPFVFFRVIVLFEPHKNQIFQKKISTQNPEACFNLTAVQGLFRVLRLNIRIKISVEPLSEVATVSYFNHKIRPQDTDVLALFYKTHMQLQGSLWAEHLRSVLVL